MPSEVDVAPKCCPSCGARFPRDALFCTRDGAPLAETGSRESGAATADPYVGRELFGHIEIRQLAGIGSMGRVYRALQKGLDRDVAVKVLHRELSANPQVVARFHREAKVASQLQHPNLVQVLLAGELPDQSLCIVMEFLNGMSLRSALAASGGAMPLGRVLHIGAQLCGAVGEAHAEGIVHRDLKPENVMLVRRGEDADFVKVLDFGVARVTQGEPSMMTAQGLIFGTARYISPEGAQGEPVGPPSDVYSIATLLYQMLAGRTPFEGDQAVALLLQQISDPPPPLRSLPRCADVPAAFADVIMRGLQKRATDRQADARVFGRELAEATRNAGWIDDTRVASTTPAPSARVVASETAQLTTPAAAGAAPSAATTRWTPPAAFQAQLAGSARELPSSVEATIDDGSPMLPPISPRPPPVSPRPPPVSLRGPAQTELAAPSQGPPIATTPGAPPIAPILMATPGPDRSAGRRAEPHGAFRVVLLVLACFVVGVVGATVVAMRLGLLGQTTAVSADALLARAEAAFEAKRWDTPPGDNVRELTAQGLASSPSDGRFVALRERASKAIATAADERRRDSDLTEALRLARLALELAPSNDEAKRVVDACERDADTAPALPPLSSASAAQQGKAPPVPTAPATTTRAMLSLAPPSGRPGQTVTFSAQIVGPSSGAPEDAHFVVVGSGVGTVHLAAIGAGPGEYRAGYTFSAAGTYQVSFSARVDGAPLRASRSIAIGAARPGPTPSRSAETPPAPPTASARWL